MALVDATADRLLALYHTYVGEPDQERDVYLGFALFFGGIALGAIGLGLFLFSATIERGADPFWQFRQLALVLTFVGVPAFILSIVVLLPSKRTATVTAGLGTVVCLGAIGLFIAVYPHAWNVPTGPDHSTTGILIYATGLVLLAAATGSSLVAHHLERISDTTPVAQNDASSASNGSSTETVTDEQVARDIKEASEATDISWGGVEKTDTRRLTINTPDIEVTESTIDTASAKTTRAEGVDDAVSGLKQLQGAEAKVGKGGGSDDQTQALKALRERQRQEAQQQSRVDKTISHVKDKFGFN